MFIDFSINVQIESYKSFLTSQKRALGHIGTHCDVFGKEFPISYMFLQAIIFNVSKVMERDIKKADFDNDKLAEGIFPIFYTGHSEKLGLGTKEYTLQSPQLSLDLISYLVNKKVKMIGIDGPGIRNESDQNYTDEYCTSKDIFIIENLTNLSEGYEKSKGNYFKTYTFPLNFKGLDAVPCRVIGEI